MLAWWQVSRRSWETGDSGVGVSRHGGESGGYSVCGLLQFWSPSCCAFSPPPTHCCTGRPATWRTGKVDKLSAGREPRGRCGGGEASPAPPELRQLSANSLRSSSGAGKHPWLRTCSGQELRLHFSIQSSEEAERRTPHSCQVTEPLRSTPVPLWPSPSTLAPQAHVRPQHPEPHPNTWHPKPRPSPDSPAPQAQVQP